MDEDQLKEILERLKEKEERIWQGVRTFWFYPKLSDPILVGLPDVDYDSIPQGIKKELVDKKGAPEFITYTDKQTYINLLKVFEDLLIKDEKELENGMEVDEKELEKSVEILELHAVGHYKLCAYDLLTRLILSYNAVKALKSQGAIDENIDAQKTGSNLSNVFEDIVVNTFLVEEGEERGFPQNKENVCFLYDRFNKKREIDPEYKKLPRKSWDVYMRVLERLWEEEGRWVNKKKFSEDQEKAAERIYTLLKDDMVNSRNWERRCYRFTQILSPFIKEDGQQGRDMQMFENESSGQAKNLKQMLQQMQGMKDKKGKGSADEKDLEKKIKEMQKKMESEVQGLAKRMNKGGNNQDLLQEYKELTIGSGIASNEQMAEKWFYRDLASEYTVKFQPLIKTAGKAHPFTPKKWNTSDPPQKLDLRYTLQIHGVAIPGVTTSKWKYQKSRGFAEGGQPPDLYEVFDSSGSMVNPTHATSPAVVGGMAAAHSALNVGAKVAVMNFSSDITSIYETTDEDKIDDCLLLYKNGGTDLPTKELKSWVKNVEIPKQFLIITDAGFANFDDAFPYFKELLELNPKNRGAIFCIGGGFSDYIPKLESIGYEVFHVYSPEDLRDVVVGKAREVYEGKFT